MPRDFTIIPKNAAAALEGNKAERKFSATLDTTLTSAATNPLYNHEELQKSLSPASGLSPASAMAIKGPLPSREQRREQRRYLPFSENEESGQVGAAARRPVLNYSQAFRETSAKAEALELELKKALEQVEAYKALLATVSAPTSDAASPPHVAVTKTIPNFSRTTIEKLEAAKAATLAAEAARDEALETARTEAGAKEKMAEELTVAKAAMKSLKLELAKLWRAESAKLKEKAKAELEAAVARVQEEMEIKLTEERATRLAAEEALAAAETRTRKGKAATSSRSGSDRQQNAGVVSNGETIYSASSAQEKRGSGQFRPAGRLKVEKLELTELFGAKSRVDTPAVASVRHEISSSQLLESAESVEKVSGSPIKAESLSAVASSGSQKAILGRKELSADDSPAPVVGHPSAKSLSNPKRRFR